MVLQQESRPRVAGSETGECMKHEPTYPSMLHTWPEHEPDIELSMQPTQWMFLSACITCLLISTDSIREKGSAVQDDFLSHLLSRAGHADRDTNPYADMLTMTPCDLFPYLRGRTLWLLGDATMQVRSSHRMMSYCWMCQQEIILHAGQLVKCLEAFCIKRPHCDLQSPMHGPHCCTEYGRIAACDSRIRYSNELRCQGGRLRHYGLFLTLGLLTWSGTDSHTPDSKINPHHGETEDLKNVTAWYGSL